MSRSPWGGFGPRSVNKEWGRKARKSEDHDRGFRRRVKDEIITEQLDELMPVPEEDEEQPDDDSWRAYYDDYDYFDYYYDPPYERPYLYRVTELLLAIEAEADACRKQAREDSWATIALSARADGLEAALKLVKEKLGV